ncbi:autism susceptibility gene 2 protein-like isoform X5 [Mizuhopecten yessoensis]|uniref:autism susceptibility gene 2 protein-like isoform X5 n=1 Tax=Mizuhopecten yessoensis TaxID=6573 RepID=UPI000B45AE0C|nr:autism susceptibility gene 2 protein-like isoform X5 [Mizuhopecten yessoensis]
MWPRILMDRFTPGIYRDKGDFVGRGTWTISCMVRHIHASDASSDIFTTVNTVNRSRECIVTNNTSTPTVCSSPCPAGITTTPSLSSPATTATTTAAPTTTSALTVSATTTCGTITTSCSPVSVAAPITTPSVISSGPRTAPPTAPPAKRPTLPPSSPTSSHPALTASRPPSRTAQIHNRENRKSSSPLPPPRPLANKREEHREKDPQLPSSLPFSKSRTSANSSGHHRYSPQISPSASIPPYPLHSTPNHTPTFPPHHPQLPPHPPSAHTPGHPPHSMFAPPLPPGPAGASLTSGSLSGASAVSLSSHSPSDSMSYANQEILREELNRRFLATQDRPVPSIGGAHPFIRSDVHQHQHQHMHQHQHTHQHMYPIHIPGSLGPPPAPLLYEKVPKLDSPFYRPQIPGLQTYPTGMSPLMPPAGPGPLNSGLNSGIPGAFQPKRVSSSLHPAQMMLASLRDRDKANPTPGGGLPAQKKSGKWCAVHVRIAWEIYQHQQRQSDTQKGQSEGKNVEPLRPPSHLLLGSSVHKGPELGPTPGLMGPGGPRSILESSGHAGLIGQNAINMTPFPRPSAYSALPGGFSGFGGLGKKSLSPFRAPFSSGRDVPTVHGMTPPPHEWGNRLHRTPPSFPTPWPKQMEEREKEEREREKERDLEREREKEREKRDYIGLDRRREDDRERERRNSERLQINCLTDRSRDRDKIFPTESVRPARSRSRSRSPLQNGRVGSAKSDSSFERRFDDRGGLKIKEERRDEDMLHGERDKIRNEYMLGPSMPNPNNPLAMFDRSRLFMGASPFLAADRVPSHPLWQYEKNAMEFNHRMQLQQEMERERLIHRIPSHATSLQEMEQERMRKEELLFQDERFRRDYLSSMPMYERERLAAYEQQSRFSGLRTAELGATSHFNRTLSPMVNHAGARTTLSPMVNHIGARTMSPMVNHVGVKGSSPACAPPPLIPSSSAASHSHSNSPAVAKAKGHHGEPGLGDKRDTYSNSTDPESHSR